MINRSDTNPMNHRTLGHRLGHVLRDVLVGLDVLNRIHYDRPWERLDGDMERRANRPRAAEH